MLACVGGFFFCWGMTYLPAGLDERKCFGVDFGGVERVKGMPTQLVADVGSDKHETVE